MNRADLERHGKRAGVLVVLVVVVKVALVAGGAGVAIVLGVSTLLVDVDWEAL